MLTKSSAVLCVIRRRPSPSAHHQRLQDRHRRSPVRRLFGGLAGRNLVHHLLNHPSPSIRFRCSTPTASAVVAASTSIMSFQIRQRPKLGGNKISGNENGLVGKLAQLRGQKRDGIDIQLAAIILHTSFSTARRSSHCNCRARSYIRSASRRGLAPSPTCLTAARWSPPSGMWPFLRQM